MKIFKRNAVMITVLLFVGVAVYLNWSYDKKMEEASKLADETGTPTEQVITDEVKAETLSETAEKTQKAPENAGLFYSEQEDTAAAEDATSEVKQYFAGVRLDRTRARDEAQATLQAVALSDGASQATVDSALEKMTKMADWTVKEAELENLINAKGFIDCVVYISEDGISVTVAAQDGLSGVGVAKITDIVLDETEFAADQLKIIEIK